MTGTAGRSTRRPGRRHRPGSRRGGDRLRGEPGQASVEVALVAPLAMLLMLLLVQVGVLVQDQVLVVAAAREAARAAAVTAEDAAPRRAAAGAGRLDPGRLRVDVGRGAGDGLVRARVEYRAATTVPMIGVLLPDVTLTAVAAMRNELAG